jgi:hypothetical protein
MVAFRLNSIHLQRAATAFLANHGFVNVDPENPHARPELVDGPQGQIPLDADPLPLGNNLPGAPWFFGSYQNSVRQQMYYLHLFRLIGESEFFPLVFCGVW